MCTISNIAFFPIIPIYVFVHNLSWGVMIPYHCMIICIDLRLPVCVTTFSSRIFSHNHALTIHPEKSCVISLYEHGIYHGKVKEIADYGEINVDINVLNTLTLISNISSDNVIAIEFVIIFNNVRFFFKKGKT